ncbi:MAG: sigma-54-dependent Fis family transcriptional regulator [Candidatus Hydrogenedentes bacterium]|nr:sigma-54-dependent Fis family transcriptional regulator [Candidatus Hydrogenedentota bacterium]
MKSELQNSRQRVLIATDDVPYATGIARLLSADGFQVERCPDARSLLRLSGRRILEVVILDLELGDGADVDLVSFVRRQFPQAQLILLFNAAKIDRAIDGIRQGAYFYLPKNSEPLDLKLVVHKAVRSLQTEAKVSAYEQNVFEEMVGATPAMRRVIETIGKVAPTDSTVLLLGESGSGKEVLANALHRLSPRRDRPFIAVNCAALPEGLLESELFGHVKGAFTGADGDKRGLFEEADGGTIFLDEIGDMALVTQAKLLRVLQNGEIRRVGASTTQLVDVRIVAATNRDLVEAVRERKFREDLYFRLNVIQIRVPPLRERMEALPSLTSHFLERFNARYNKNVQGLDEHAQSLLRSYAFPGNVRELESIIAHAVIMSDGVIIHAHDLPDAVRGLGGVKLALPNYANDHVTTLAEMESALIRTALEKLQGNQTDAAKKLGISRSTLWRKMKEYGIQK